MDLPEISTCRDLKAYIHSPETMYNAVEAVGILPFFRCGIDGFSVEDMLKGRIWDFEETLGPWDWKIDLVQSGDIAYGKFIYSGKSAFLTREWFIHLMNYRRGLPKYRPKEGELGFNILSYLDEKGSLQVSDIRKKFDLKKAKADSTMARIQMGTYALIGDIERVYKGPQLRYEGWQRVSYCRPEVFFDEDDSLLPPFLRKSGRKGLDPGCTPEESYSTLKDRIHELCPWATEKEVARLLG